MNSISGILRPWRWHERFLSNSKQTSKPCFFREWFSTFCEQNCNFLQLKSIFAKGWSVIVFQCPSFVISSDDFYSKSRNSLTKHTISFERAVRPLWRSLQKKWIITTNESHWIFTYFSYVMRVTVLLMNSMIKIIWTFRMHFLCESEVLV